jgi:TldD protein
MISGKVKKAKDFLKNTCDVDAVCKSALPAFCSGVCGELFIEYKEDEILRIENSIVQTPNFNFRHGFGLRTFVEDVTRYSYSSILDVHSINNAVEVVKSACNGSGIKQLTSSVNRNNLYEDAKFLDSISLKDKINFLKEVDSYARSKSERVKQVVAVLASSWQVVCIMNEAGEKVYDIRPLLRFTVSVIVEKNNLMESGMSSGGGRFGYDSVVNEKTKIEYVDEAFRQANIKLEAVKAPVGEMPVILGNAWTGILLHEAVGHGLEGDAIRKKTSLFHNLLGEKIAAQNVTVVDDGTIHGVRGSINVDDEGVQSNRNVLIENGKLVNFLQDRMNARLMNSPTTGNGRRENYECVPMPRMTNTFMLAGDKTFDEMLSNVKKGIFAKTFSDGQVDIASGKFVFSASEAYLVEDGKVTAPVKGAMLIGDGKSVLNKISMIGNDFSLDSGVGTCGKDGQWVPVGVGQPSVLIDKITVGGSNL